MLFTKKCKFILVFLLFIPLFSVNLFAKNEKTEVSRIVAWQRPTDPPLWWTNIEEWKKTNQGEWFVISSELVSSENIAYSDVISSSKKIIDLKHNEVIELETYFMRAYNVTYSVGRQEITERKFICYGLFNKKTIRHPLDEEFRQRIDSAEKNLSDGNLTAALYDYEAAEYIRLKNPELQLPMSIAEIKKINSLLSDYQNYLVKVQNSFLNKNYIEAKAHIKFIREFMQNNNIKKTGYELDIIENNINQIISGFHSTISDLKEKYQNNQSVFNGIIRLINDYYSNEQFNFDEDLKQDYNDLFLVKNSNNIMLKDYYIFAEYNIPDDFDVNFIQPFFNNFEVIDGKYSAGLLSNYFTNKLVVNVVDEGLTTSNIDRSIMTKRYLITANFTYQGNNHRLNQRLREISTNIDIIIRNASDKIQTIIQDFVDGIVIK